MNKNKFVCKKFTFMELALAILIMALLAGIVAPAVMNKLGNAKKVTAKTQISILEGAVDDYMFDTGTLPDSLNDLIVNSGHKKWNGPYLRKKVIPKDPWGNEYLFNAPGDHDNKFDILSYGADGESGGEGDKADIGNWVEEE